MTIKGTCFNRARKAFVSTSTKTDDHDVDTILSVSPQNRKKIILKKIIRKKVTTVSDRS